MTLYGVGTNKKLHIKLNKSDIAGLISAKYGCKVKPEEVGGKRGRKKNV